ncbi:hypothetical protein JKA74_03505 [Marivirga sp. S37H4]|uniref:eRF1 domain-containing protein n=1 Tax=Marivirga aurantiaca TaxID=2802615 RepID=A0A934WW77_9BACT|nr:hypothetical protein [Marivirga aurantiaca]MBK6264092.1 hypothetical protein [Marivirga aurantiaca]
MEILRKEMLEDLKAEHTAPCISLYLPTHKTSPGRLKDPINYKNLLKQLEQSLRQKYSVDETKSFLKPFEELADNEDFWIHTTEGLAVFSSPDFFKTIVLQMPIKEQLIVSDSFFTKPLRNYLQTKDRFQVLAINLFEIRLFEGNRHSLSEVALHPSVAKDMEEALLDDELEDRNKRLTVASYGGVGIGSVAMRHGHGHKKDKSEKYIERFFRVVSEDIELYHSKPTGLPLLLAALPEHHHLFREVNKNPLLMKEKIEIDPFGVPVEKLSEMAWKVIEPNYLSTIENLMAEFEEANGKGAGSINLEEIGKAMALGQIHKLLVANDTTIGGKVEDKTTGTLKTGDIEDPEVGDLTDEIAEIVMDKGGEVIVIPKEKMPNQAGLAAIYRYKL